MVTTDVHVYDGDWLKDFYHEMNRSIIHLDSKKLNAVKDAIEKLGKKYIHHINGSNETHEGGEHHGEGHGAPNQLLFIFTACALGGK